MTPTFLELVFLGRMGHLYGIHAHKYPTNINGCLFIVGYLFWFVFVLFHHSLFFTFCFISRKEERKEYSPRRGNIPILVCNLHLTGNGFICFFSRIGLSKRKRPGLLLQWGRVKIALEEEIRSQGRGHKNFA